MSNVRPCNDNNAIKVVAYALDFAQEIDENLIKQVISLYNADEELNQDLTRSQPQQSFNIAITNGVQVQQETLGGILFENFAGGSEPVWSLVLRKNGLAVTCRDYTRWDSIWPQAKGYLSKIISLLNDIPVASTTLEYVDEFIIDNIHSAWKEELFKQDNSYIMNNVFNIKDFWHSHHGYFTQSESSSVDKVLNTINIEYVQEEPRKISKIVIRTQHKSLISGILISDSFLNEVFSEIIENNHRFNKEILIDLLSDSVLESIKLKG